MFTTHTHAKGQGQMSLGSIIRVKQTDRQMDGQTDGGDCTNWLANAVGKHMFPLYFNTLF